MSTLPGFTLVVLLLAAGPAAADGLVLKKDVELKGSTVAGKEGPLFLSADRIESTAPDVIVATGNVEARQAGQNFFADWLLYDTTQDLVQARGAVRLEQAAMVVTGDSLKYHLDDYSGEFIRPVYQLAPSRPAHKPGSPVEASDTSESSMLSQPGRGHADRIDFLNENQCTLHNATYTTCPLGNDDWFLKVRDLDLDKGRNVGTAHSASLHFLGVPILYTPWLDFPLNNARKSGVLAPTFGTTQRSGIDLMVPYYLNLAPNYDATLYPRMMSKRGVQLGTEFRYLLNDAHGVNRVEYLPNDAVADRSRWSMLLNNIYRVNATTEAGMLFNRVSDNDYFRDLSNLLAVTSLTNLDQEAWLTTQHANWYAEVRAQQYQTLQDSTSPIPLVEPYARLPQTRFGVDKIFENGLEFKLESEATRFAHPTLVEGTRVLAYPTLRMPLTNSFGFLTPQIGWHSTYYSLDNRAAVQNISRNLPIFSLDSGVTFDRPFRFAGHDYQQTLEPRAYYVYAPYRDQSNIPVFDTALLDFSYAQMFTENQFIGGDRVNDANQLTVAVTSRFTEAASGLERLQVTLGQRYYFSAQEVTLPGMEPRASNSSDLLAAVSGQITHDWHVDTAWQFDAQNGTTLRQNLGVSYRPAPGRVLNLGYRFIDQTTEQVDVSAEWPLARRWYGMFRYNYSFKDSKLVEGLAGLEYNGGCWALRGVVQRLATKTNQSTDTLFFQLVLNGMGGIGSNPLDVLKRSVPGYRPSNEIIQTP
ncbi:MAG: LPS-assembly protein LptD [Betaproteobacteria bacterium]|nr:LPS-assembly protein LptD [Betaproteobacteria bacterium]